MKNNSYRAGAPHMRGSLTADRITGYLILALLPSVIYGMILFGKNAVILVFTSVVSALVADVILDKYGNRPVKRADLRTVFAALLLACALPSSAPWQTAAVGGALCVIIMRASRRFFRRNVVSPVILTRLILGIVFKEQMSMYLFDGLTMATPLAALKNGEAVNTLYMITGKTAGCVGETSVLLLCFGAIFLLLLGIIDFRVSGMYLFAFAAFMAVFGGEGLSSYFLTAHLAGGGFMLTLWFIAPDYSTIPITKEGRFIYGALLGVLTGIFRLYGPSAENICYAVLIANLCVPLIEKITVRRPFGVEKGRI